MDKAFTIAFVRDLESQYAKEEISYSRMVELLNEQSEKYAAYRAKERLEKFMYEDEEWTTLIKQREKESWNEALHWAAEEAEIKSKITRDSYKSLDFETPMHTKDTITVSKESILKGLKP